MCKSHILDLITNLGINPDLMYTIDLSLVSGGKNPLLVMSWQLAEDCL